MRISLQSKLALLVSAVFHAVLLVVFTTPLEIGRNVPVLVHPVRERSVQVQLVQMNAALTSQRDAAIMQAMDTVTPAASAGEGRLDQFTKQYAEFSQHYFTPNELDYRPIVINPPDLGEINLSPTMEGEAVLLFYLDENGSVVKTEVERSSLPELMMQQLRLQREHLRFVPGNKNGVNVKSVIRYKIVLERDPSITVIPNENEFVQ